jgi:hypothetical protein
MIILIVKRKSRIGQKKAIAITIKIFTSLSVANPIKSATIRIPIR